MKGETFRKNVLPILTGVGGLVLGVVGPRASEQSPGGLSDDLFKWIANNGFAVVIALLLLMLLRYVIIDAVAHFNMRLDTATVEQSAGFRGVVGAIEHMDRNVDSQFGQTRMEQSAAFRDLAHAIGHLDETLDKLAVQASANNEAIRGVMFFISHTQQEIVAHRSVVEGSSKGVPSPPMTAEERAQSD